MSLEVEANIEVGADVQVDADVEVEVDAPVEVEVDADVQVDAEVEVEVEAPDVQAEIEVPVDAGLQVEGNVEEPMINVEIGGNIDVTESGPTSCKVICHLVCGIVFCLFTISALGAFLQVTLNYQANKDYMIANRNSSAKDADLALTICIIAFACFTVLWLILSIGC